MYGNMTVKVNLSLAELIINLLEFEPNGYWPKIEI
jgi:hypothetical protein